MSKFVRWLGRLSVGRKLSLIYLLDLSAVIYVSGILIHEKLDAIDFTRKEVVGAAYTEAVRQHLMGALLGQPLAGGPGSTLAEVRAANDDALKATEQATQMQARLDALAAATPEIRAKATDAAFSNFQKLMGDLKQALGAAEITPDSLAEDLRAEWISSDGLVRLEVTPKGDSNDRLVMTKFAEAVQVVAPNASGPPVIVSEAGRSITRAFLEAGLYALIAIFIILAVALRNPLDVALTLGPLVLAGIMSLEAADMAGMSLNFANVIALPLMFGVGVAFHIYYVIAWRKGVVDMLASSLTRAIFFSSLTTGVAFGSLYLSSHPGTASMGELLIISLFFTLLAAFIIVPAFLGPPRQNGDQSSDGSKAL